MPTKSSTIQKKDTGQESNHFNKKGRASVVVMSVADYERQKKRAWKNVLLVMDETAGYAASQGLTESRLERLLVDES